MRKRRPALRFRFAPLSKGADSRDRGRDMEIAAGCGFLRLVPISERKADRQTCVVIGGMKVSGSDLVPAAERKAHSLPKVKAPDEQTRSHKVLLLAIILSVLKECRVELDFRPELPKYAVL